MRQDGRRRALFAGAAAVLATPAWGPAAEIAPGNEPPRGLGFGFTPAACDERVAGLGAWDAYLTRRLGRPVQVSSRVSVRETMDMLKHRQLDFAWISPVAYVYLAQYGFVRRVTTPVIAGEHASDVCLLVGADDTRTRSLLDLEGRIFSFDDPFSLAGWVAPRRELRVAGRDPSRFFGRSFFTRSPHRVVEAVAAGVADAGSVGGFVWDAMSRRRPELGTAVRVVARTGRFGLPPVVAGRGVTPTEMTDMRAVLEAMPVDPEGRGVLASFGIDAFELADERIYEVVARQMRESGDA